MMASTTRSWFIVIVSQLILIYNIFEILIPLKTNFNTSPIKDSINLSTYSKAEIVKELKTIKKQIGQFEKINGQSDAAGFKVYSPQETAVLLNYYKKLRSGLEYLNRGVITDIKDWEGYFWSEKERTYYKSEEALQVLKELKESHLPPEILAGFRVYLLPIGIPEVSGLGGTGFAMVSAPENDDKSFEQLRVTLLHELGHHVHSKFMPSMAGLPSPLWGEYLRIRDGKWHNAGDVNTAAWNDSSEETFAEDFRLLFGKNQYYYGDISLGDPRDNPETAMRVRRFILDLINQKKIGKVRSPWAPKGLKFWLNSQYYIFLGWTIIIGGLGAFLYRSRRDGQGSYSMDNNFEMSFPRFC